MLVREPKPPLGFVQRPRPTPHPPGHQHRKPGHGLALATLSGPLERAAEVLAVAKKPGGEEWNPRLIPASLGLQQLDKPVGVPAAHLAGLAGFLELLDRVF